MDADLVIVGSGITALYLAYLLSNSSFSGRKILLISSDNHVGGRIASLSSDSKEYKVELCASRIYADVMPKITKLIAKLRLPVTVIPADDLPVVTPPPNPIFMGKTMKMYPPNQRNRNQEITFSAAMTLATGNYKNAVDFISATGYNHQLRDQNLASTYEEYDLSGQSETRLKNGFQSVAKALKKEILKAGVVEMKMGSRVTEIKETSSGVILTVNDDVKISCSKLVLTGTMKQMRKIKQCTSNWGKRLKLMDKLYQAQPAVKIYLTMENPWWNSKEITKFAGYPLLSQMIYYSGNTILFYVTGEEANTLLNIFQQDNACQDHWIKASSASNTVKYLIKQIPSIIKLADNFNSEVFPTNEQLSSVKKLVFHYVEQAATTVTALKSDQICNPGLDKLYSYIQRGSKKNNAIFYLGGDLEKNGGGWVENCLGSVDNAIDQIVHDLR